MTLKRSATAMLAFAAIALYSVGSMEPAASHAAIAIQQQESLAPFVPTPQSVVDRMLALAEVTSNDTVYDIGCGDGRIVITAAKKYSAHGVGIDYDPERIRESKENAKKAGVENLVKFIQQDAMTADYSPASVVTMYLLTASNLKLRPILTKQLKPGARIVSHAFSMGDWEPVKTDTFEDENSFNRTIYLWKADGKVRP